MNTRHDLDFVDDSSEFNIKCKFVSEFRAEGFKHGGQLVFYIDKCM